MITFFISLSMLSVWLDSFIRDIYGVKPGVKLEGQDISGLLREEVRGLVMEMAMQEWLLPQEPEIDKKTGRIIPEKPGIIVDVQSTINNVMQAQANQSVALVRNSIPSKYRSEDLAFPSVHILPVSMGLNRGHNIALAATYLTR